MYRIQNSIFIVDDLSGMPNGDYVVELLADGQKLMIHKPGYKGGDDFEVYRTTNGFRGEALKFEDILAELDGAIALRKADGHFLLEEVFKVYWGKEPPVATRLSGPNRSGDYLLKALKWIFAAEDANYPRGMGLKGRILFGERLAELSQGVSLATVVSRVNPDPNNDLANVNYKVVRSIRDAFSSADDQAFQGTAAAMQGFGKV